MKESTTTCVNLFADNSSNARSAAYLYNPAGQLLSETTYNDLGTVQQTKHYIWVGTVPIAILQPAANDADDRVIYLHSDHLDTPRKATKQNQQLVWQWQSDAFGQTAANDDPDNDGTVTTINLRFPGQYYDVESGLHYNYFRDYDPVMGRYMQSDPIGLNGGLDSYGYVLSNPTGFYDTLGLFCLGSVWKSIIAGAVGGAVAGAVEGLASKVNGITNSGIAIKKIAKAAKLAKAGALGGLAEGVTQQWLDDYEDCSKCP